MAAEQRFRAMGSDAHLIVVGRPESVSADPGAAALVLRARRRLEELERTWSRFLPHSEVAELNRRRGEDVTVGWETRRLVERALEGWRLSGGRVDPTVLDDLVRAGYDRSFEQLPAPPGGLCDDTGPADPAEPADGGACPPGVRGRRSGCSGIRVGPATVGLPPGHGFDPGGLGKGLAADLVVEELRSLGAAGVCLNLGGDLRVAGVAPGGGTWTVAVEQPSSPLPIALLGLAGGAVATSTTLRRRWRHGAEVAHHLIDPVTGRPCRSDLVQATAVAAEAWMAEVLAKDVVLRGASDPFRAAELAGAEALAVDRDGRVLATAGLAAFLGGATLPGRVDVPSRRTVAARIGGDTSPGADEEAR